MGKFQVLDRYKNTTLTIRKLYQYSLSVNPKRGALAAVFVIIGFNSILLQSMFIREFFSVFSNNELSLGIFFAFWLLWPALGSGLLGRWTSRMRNKAHILLLTQILLFFIIPLILLLARTTRVTLGVLPGEEVGIFQIFYWIGLLLLPLGIIYGLQFPLACELYKERTQEVSKGVSRVYFLDTLGDMLGGAVFGYIFIKIFHSFQTTSFILGLILFSLLLIIGAFRLKKVLILIPCALAIVWTVFTFNINRINDYATRLAWRDFNVVFKGRSKYARYAVTKKENLYSFFENGGWVFSYPYELSSEELATFSMLQTPEPERVLIIGGGTSGIIRQILKYRVKKVYYVELDPLYIELSEKFLKRRDIEALRDPRVDIVKGDGWLFVKNYRKEKFDCVIINTGNPTNLTLNRFYTREFFSDVRRIINKNGVILIHIASGENYLSERKKSFNASIYYTLKRSFPYIIPIPGEELFLIGSQDSSYITKDPQTLSLRLKERGIANRFVDENYIPYRVYPPRVEWIDRIMKTARARINRAFKPISCLYYLTLWGAQYSKELASFFYKTSKLPFYLLILIIAGIGLLGAIKRREGKGLALWSVFSVGMAGIGLEISLILGFQVLYGYVYHLIGIVIASFMLGILIGNHLMIKRLDLIKNPLSILGWTVFICAVYSITLPFLIVSLSPLSGKAFINISTWFLFPFLNIVAGFFVGAVFVLSSRIYLKEKGEAGKGGGLIYATDLIGGMAGSLLTSLFFLPIFGIIQTCILLGMINLIVALLLFFRTQRP